MREKDVCKFWCENEKTKPILDRREMQIMRRKNDDETYEK